MVSGSITFIYIKKFEVLPMFAIILALIVLCIVVGVLFNVKQLLNLTTFIITVILCMMITVINVLTMTLPTTLILLMIITTLGLLLKHYHLFTFKKGKTFLNKMMKHFILGVLFTAILAYLSTMPIPIINGIFLWLTMIAISTCYAFLLYMAWSSALGRITTQNQYALIMVLGAGIFTKNVTPMLADRLNRALSVYHQQKGTCNLLVSGGQGPDEPISEALAMKHYLIDYGVPESNIILEDQSTNTFENFYYSKRIIRNLYKHRPSILCVTSQFHILRGMRFAQINQMKVDGIGSHTPYHFFNIALIRDFLALMYQYKLLLTIYFAILFFASIYILF